MVEQFPKDVKVVFKNFPLRNHNMAMPAAQAAYAAHQQGKFWPYHDALFKDYNRLSEQKFSEVAQQVGLDLERYEQDRKGVASQQAIRLDMQQAQAAGLRGTPAIYINGLETRDRSPEGLRGIIEAELARKGVTNRSQ